MTGHDDPEHHDAEGYDGEVTVAVDGAEPTTAHAALAARFDPLAGHVVWTGRLRRQLDPGTELELTTPHGAGRARVTERDVWGNSRLRGLTRPPFPVALLDETEPAER